VAVVVVAPAGVVRAPAAREAAVARPAVVVVPGVVVPVVLPRGVSVRVDVEVPRGDVRVVFLAGDVLVVEPDVPARDAVEEEEGDEGVLDEHGEVHVVA
jgi:hypothetical protein